MIYLLDEDEVTDPVESMDTDGDDEEEEEDPVEEGMA